jgi:hypothetical protein
VTRYRKILELLPERSELWKNIAELELARGAGEDAAKAYREYLRAHPDRVDALQNLAVLDLRAGRLDDARTRLEAAIKAAPSADLYYNLGNVHLKAANNVLALASYHGGRWSTSRAMRKPGSIWRWPWIGLADGPKPSRRWPRSPPSLRRSRGNAPGWNRGWAGWKPTAPWPSPGDRTTSR